MGGACDAGSASVQSAQSITILKQVLQQQQQQGQAAVEMLQAAAQVQRIAAAEPGKGAQVDVTA